MCGGVALVVLACLLNFSIFPAVNPISDTFKASIISTELRKSALEGAIVDRNGLAITQLATTSETMGAVTHDYAYSFLLGYNTTTYGARGLRDTFGTYLYETLDQDSRGATLQLSLDSRLQAFCYDEILAGEEGSVIVLDNKTGAVLAMTSASTVPYSLNELSDFLQESVAVDGSQLDRATQVLDPPGSVFKVITATAALEMPLAEASYVYNDTGAYAISDDVSIYNASHAVYGTLDLQQALSYSSNVYFSYLTESVGYEQMDVTAQSFLLGTDIVLDFATLHSNWTVDNTDPVAYVPCGFGQGSTLVSPTQMCMWMQAIANGGLLCLPHVVDSATSEEVCVYQGQVETLQIMSAETAETMKNLLYNVGEHYDLGDGIAAKTGTAELSDGTCHIYIAGFTDEISFIISKNHGTYGSTLRDPATQLVAFWENLNAI